LPEGRPLERSLLGAAQGRRVAVITKIRLEDRAEEIDETWSPIDVARVNDQVVRMAKIQGQYHWHKHTNEDELFYVLSGSITIQLRDQPDVALSEGEMAVIPKGMEHRPTSEGLSHILMLEPYALVSRGD
jgi:mannose-6-phosphate isomerase-like protein (cupin superfamily)